MAATEQKKENPDTETGPTDGEKKKPNILMIAVGLLIFLLVVAVGGFVGYTQLPQVVAGITGAGDGAIAIQTGAPHPEAKGIITLEPFLVNLADITGITFLRATFQLGMEEVQKTELDSNSIEVATIRDAIITLLCSKNSDEIMTPEGKENLRDEIRTVVNERMPRNRVAEVFIVDFVVQL